MTSNLCQDGEFEPRPHEDDEQRRDRESRVLESLVGHFRPEFLNRLDGIVRFASLGQEMILKIVRLELAKVGRSLAEQDITLEVTDSAVARLADQGFDPRFGARPVRRVIQQEVQDRLADLILAGEALPEQTVVLDVDGGEFTLSVRHAESRVGS